MTSKKNIGILIAEDSRTQAEQLGFLLEQHGYQVTIAANGKLALQAAQAQQPDLLISDIVMPEMDGYELCRAIKSDENLKDVPVILVTTLSDAHDVILGLACGADNFIRKPYDEHYLLSRIDYLLMNQALRTHQKMQIGIEIELGGHKYLIDSGRQQILDLLISTYEQAIQISNELKLREKDLEHSNQILSGLYLIAEGLNQAVGEQAVAEAALERAMELPGIQAGWLSLWDGASGFRLAAVRNLPPALLREGAMEGLCDCQRRFLAGELDCVTNIMECKRLKEAQDDTHGLRYHASVPLWTSDRTVGIMNLVGAEQGLFVDAELKMLYGVGNQVAVALERARLHEHLELLVDERTAALRASEDRLNRAQAVAQIGSWQLDLASNRLEWSAEAHRIFGVPGREAVDLDTFVSTLHPDDREMVLKAWGEAVAGAPYDIEHRIVANGETRWVRERAIIERDAEGRALFGIGTTQDITERKQAETMLRESEEKFRAIFEGTLDGVLLADAQSRRFTTGNPAICRMLGYSIDELTRLGVADIHPQQDLPHVIEQFEAQLRGEIQLAENLPVRHRDGSVLYADIKSSAVNIGDKTYLVGVFRDITQRKQADAVITEQFNELRRWYAATQGREMRTIELKREVNELLMQAGQPPRYPSAELSNAAAEGSLRSSGEPTGVPLHSGAGTSVPLAPWEDTCGLAGE
ncbi:MAG: PAS domain S-box protein [Gallionella sp.]